LLFVTYLVANIIALVYAFLISQPPLQVKYSIAIATSILYLSVFFYYSFTSKE